MIDIVFFSTLVSILRSFLNFSIDKTPWTCQVIAVIMKNGILTSRGYYQGTYQISETLNGKPSWEVSGKTIWYISDINAWAIGPSSFVESDIGYIMAYDYFGGLTDDQNVWGYYSYDQGGTWMTSGPNDTSVQCCQTVIVSLKNNVLAIYESYQGIYQISETVYGQASWKKDGMAIWYTEVNSWDIGPVQYIGSLYSRMYTMPTLGGLTDELNDWMYYDGQGNLLRIVETKC